jgi:glycosidase
MSKYLRRTWLAICAALLSLVGTSACSDLEYVGEAPPAGGGGFNPGGGAPSGGYGASYGSGGSGGDTPIECEPELRLCPQLFTLASASAPGAQTVEVRGSFASDGWTVGVPMSLDGDTWKATVEVPWDVDVQYKLVIDGTNWINDPANPTQIDDGFGGFNSLLAGITCDAWTCAPPTLGFDWRNAVLYFVFVDRFFDGNPANNGSGVPGVKAAANFQGGDWAGVQAKIESNYFTDLGVNALWLSVPAANTESSGLGTDGELYSAYHGYWPTDLSAPQTRFGSLAELQAVVDAAHQRDIMVIVDYAMNHVHVDSPVYQQHNDWFWPIMNGNNYCVCGQGCAWDGSDGKRCWFTDYLPDFNFNNQTARDFSVSNAMQWIVDTGVDGFRLDAVKHIEDSWLLDLRARVKAEIEPQTQQHFYMVGETFTGDKNTIAYYVDPSNMLDGQFDFPMRNALVSAVMMRSGTMYDLEGFLAGNDGFYGAGIMSTFIGNHDVPRSIHFAQDVPLWSDPWADGKDKAWSGQPGLPAQQSAFERMANAFAILFTLPGVPLIYYGDEVGMPGAGDPDNRRFMQWSGYSQGQQLLKDRIAKLSAIRAAHPALRRGSRATLTVTGDTLAYSMTEGGDVVVVVVNRGDGSANVGGLPAGSYVDALDNSSHTGSSVSVPARSTRILVAN